MRTALVTGANRGIGQQIARELAHRGHRVVLAVRDREAGEKARAELSTEHEQDHRVVEVDTGDPASIRAAADELRDAGVEVDVLVNNAAVLAEGTPLKVDEEDIDLSWRVNVRGPWLLIRAFLPGMLERGWGRIVNVSSGGGSFGEGMMLGHTAYAVTKAALNALTVGVAAEVEGDVKVNAVCPGWVRTRMGGEGAARSVEEGAAGIVRLATLDADGPNGGFFRDGEEIPW